MQVKRVWAAAVVIATLVSTPLSAAASTALPSSPPVVFDLASSGDWRCMYGPGIQIWEDRDKGGRTAIFCGTRMYIRDLWGKREQIQGDRWADRLSSFETFNTASDAFGGNNFRLCIDPNDTGSCISFAGSVYYAYVGDSFNDKISSIKDSIQNVMSPSTLFLEASIPCNE